MKLPSSAHDSAHNTAAAVIQPSNAQIQVKVLNITCFPVR